MKIKQDNSDADFGYLSINGSAVTYDTNLITNNFGPLTSTNFTDRMVSRNCDELALNFTISAVSGTSPTLRIHFLSLDVMEPSNGKTGIPPSPLPPPVVNLLISGSTAITAPTTLRFVISNGEGKVWRGNKVTSLGPMNVPMLWQVEFSVGGTLPSFLIIGTFEQRS